MINMNFNFRKFTLIELLIVIAILMVLISLLSPALKKSVDTAHVIHCMNNQKKVHNISMSYAADSNDILPALLAYSTAGATTAEGGRSVHSDHDYAYQPGAFGVAGSSGWRIANADRTGSFLIVIQGYDRQLLPQQWINWYGTATGGAHVGPFNEAFLCPNDLNITHVLNNSNGNISPGGAFGVTSPLATNRKSISYGINFGLWNGHKVGNVGTSADGKYRTLSIHTFRNPGEAVLGSETSMGMSSFNVINLGNAMISQSPTDLSYSSGGSSFNFGESQWGNNSGSLVLRHRGNLGFNAFYMDGHVSTFVYPDYPMSLNNRWDLINNR